MHTEMAMGQRVMGHGPPILDDYTAVDPEFRAVAVEQSDDRRVTRLCSRQHLLPHLSDARVHVELKLLGSVATCRVNDPEAFFI